jgi:membrane protein involved in colicin uptake
MIIHLLDIAPWPSEEVRLQTIRAMEEQEAKQAQKQAEKNMTKAEKKLEKQAKKAEKKLEKEAKKAEKKLEKQAKKAEKKMKKAEKKLEKQFNNFSAAPTKTITTIQECSDNNGEMQQASMPTGIIIAICASLVITLASAWFYRQRSTK